MLPRRQMLGIYMDVDYGLCVLDDYGNLVVLKGWSSMTSIYYFITEDSSFSGMYNHLIY